MVIALHIAGLVACGIVVWKVLARSFKLRRELKEFEEQENKRKEGHGCLRRYYGCRRLNV